MKLALLGSSENLKIKVAFKSRSVTRNAPYNYGVPGLALDSYVQTQMVAFYVRVPDLSSTSPRAIEVFAVRVPDGLTLLFILLHYMVIIQGRQ
jgi:hypothetical protein